MQDRFKFRAWDGSQMHYNDFVVTATGYIGKITEEFLGQCVFKQNDLYADIHFKLMQCTSFKDMNNKPIYEGDIVKCYYEETDGTLYYNQGVFVWNEGQARYMFEINDNNLEGFGGNSECEFEPENFEVIGNIYENKNYWRTNKNGL